MTKFSIRFHKLLLQRSFIYMGIFTTNNMKIIAFTVPFNTYGKINSM